MNHKWEDWKPPINIKNIIYRKCVNCEMIQSCYKSDSVEYNNWKTSSFNKWTHKTYKNGDRIITSYDPHDHYNPSCDEVRMHNALL